MNFLLDENVPYSFKFILEKIGHNTKTIKDLNQSGITNGEVTKLSIEEKAIIIIFDSDFLKLGKDIQKKCKIIYLKIHPRNPKVAQKLILENLDKAIHLLKKPGKVIITENHCDFRIP
ncbi:MAG: hypothetical protein EAX96_13260 [Candidatus Lokiarchaeota archaeon]|nr:hypothetical protein [Candidatus Lokiarchaeota archaeon]